MITLLIILAIGLFIWLFTWWLIFNSLTSSDRPHCFLSFHRFKTLYNLNKGRYRYCAYDYSDFNHLYLNKYKDQLDFSYIHNAYKHTSYEKDCILIEELCEVNCDSCDAEYCEDCNRKEQNWGIGYHKAEKIADRILN